MENCPPLRPLYSDVLASRPLFVDINQNDEAAIFRSAPKILPDEDFAKQRQFQIHVQPDPLHTTFIPYYLSITPRWTHVSPICLECPRKASLRSSKKTQKLVKNARQLKQLLMSIKGGFQFNFEVFTNKLKSFKQRSKLPKLKELKSL